MLPGLEVGMLNFIFPWECFSDIFSSERVAVMLNAHRQATAPDREVVLTKAVIRAADRLGIHRRLLAEVIGVSEAQISRFGSGGASLAEHTTPFELAALLVRAFRSLDAIIGGDESAARAWLNAQNLALGARPVERITSVQGLADVVAYLDARRAPL